MKFLFQRGHKLMTALLLLCPIGVTAADTPVLEWCLDDYPQRHSYPKNAKPFGPTVDLMRELALRSGFILKFSPETPFARCLKQMASGKTDLMINLNYSEERAAYMHLLPYTKGLPEVLYLRIDQQGIDTFTQLQQQSIALVRGYVYTEKLMASIKAQQLTVHEADTLDNALGLLMRQRVDAVVAPQQQAALLIANEPKYQGQFRVIALDADLITTLYAHLGFSKKSQFPQLLPAMEQALKQMMAEGRLQYRPAVTPPDKKPRDDRS